MLAIPNMTTLLATGCFQSPIYFSASRLDATSNSRNTFFAVVRTCQSTSVVQTRDDNLQVHSRIPDDETSSCRSQELVSSSGMKRVPVTDITSPPRDSMRRGGTVSELETNPSSGMIWNLLTVFVTCVPSWRSCN
ncbi:hypothetical protein MPTK1_2g06080 [Marchantia polymorpha subsp. ruderalis]|uniref:Uncharacterized protein n=1 Tax=Marchantia polymorpha TaxID=3197 RepID=A0A2R6XDQ6_MARPO|nr:hypothetical protein MARPO_0021s0063 [Marchantia polymorpha]BBN01274.1 hypothetical protein Mp_2g06080 [Marchantia polymorpha subsp. ruderalis]|eukprot:PTQ44199.1 hypothetical protein MARPO_0021s0063 [Marchantia polymorpha]